MLLILVFYFFVFIVSLGSVNMMVSVLVLEFMSWIFIQFLPSFTVFKYLLVQSIFFLFSIISLFWMKSLIILGLFLKTGSPPFHLWMIRLLAELKRASFIFLLTLHKLLPLLLMAKMLKEAFFLFFLMMSLLIFTSLMVNLSNLFLVLSLSSVLHSLWISLSSELGMSLLIFYWLVYSILLIFFVFSMDQSWVKNSSLSQSMFSSLSWLLLSGFPPFSIFWLKCHVSFSILMQMGVSLSFLLLMGSVLALSAYYRVWHFNSLITWMNSIYWTSSMMILVSVMSIFLQ